MKITFPQISIQQRGKNYTDKNFVYHNFFDSDKFGALYDRHHDYNETHIFMNRMLLEIFMTHGLIEDQNLKMDIFSFQDAHYKLLFTIESFIYWVRKNIDDMIAFNYYGFFLYKHKKEPTTLKIDCIGNLINHTGHELYKTFEKHLKNLEMINSISNTFKHSFVTSESHRLIGKGEPTVNCLGLKRNNLDNPPEWYSISLRQVVEAYDAFFVHSRETLKSFKFISE